MNLLKRCGRAALLCFVVRFSGFGQLTSTLQDLTAAKLSALYAPPPAYVSGQAPCFSESCFSGTAGDDYIKRLNRDFIGTYAVNLPNIQAANQYNFAARQWEGAVGGKIATALPAPPVYVALNLAGWDTAWANYTAQVSRCFTGEDAGKDVCKEPGALLRAAIVRVPPPFPPVIIDAPPPASSATSPIGTQNGNIFMSSSGDSDQAFPNGSVYVDGTGKQFQKSVFQTPFNVIRFWTPLGAR